MNYITLPKPRLVQRSTRPIYNGKFALTTNVNRLHRLESFIELMLQASETSPNAWWLQYHTRTNKPHETVRIIPSVLSSFNRSRVLRRSRVSGLRMCNLYERRNRFFYISDMVVSCSFDAITIASAIAEYDGFGDRVYVSLPYPERAKPSKAEFVKLADQYIEKFWRKSNLARHSVYIQPNTYDSTSTVDLIFEPKSMPLLPLLGYILNALGDRLCWLTIGNNHRLSISKTSLVEEDLYQTYKPTQLSANVRYKHFSLFGTFFNNPNYIY